MDLQKGAVFAGRFEIEGLAGSGGMADVYRALDRASGDWVALKLLRATAPDDLARLAREAQALARLAHPGIVNYVAHGAEGSEAFVAMGWVEGETLSARLRRGTLSLTDTLALGRALATALAQVHEHGIVHRDIKPQNIVLRNCQLEDPVLLDFGVARTGLAVGLTQVGTVIGTPRYMAPEQARGGLAIDARADVFALGALMFRAFTGRPPFDGDDHIAVLAHLLFDEAPHLCDLAPGVPRAVGDLVAHMLAKSAAARLADGAAVVRAIDALDALDGIPITVDAPAWSGLTLRERRLVSLMVITGKVDVDVVREVVTSFGGRAEALANDSVVVVVGGRDNATDLARVSARCALELRSRLPHAPIVLATGRGDDLRGEDGSDKQTIVSGSTQSVGPYSGVFERAAALLGRDELAAAEGRPLPIVIDDTTAGLLGSDFDVEREVSSNVCSLVGHAGVRKYALLGKPTPFVGRARELASLLVTWDDVCEQGVARASLIVAEAGIGKSRLLHEWLEGLKGHTAPAMQLYAKANATNAGSPFGALAPALRREFEIEEGESDEAAWLKFAERVGTVVPKEQTHVAEFIAEIAGVKIPSLGAHLEAARKDPRLMGDRIRQAWRAWVQAELWRGPVLIILEDLQWGDLPTVKLIDEMLRDLAEHPVFVLALARPEVDAAFPNLWSRVVERVPLAGLSKKAATTFAKVALESYPITADAIDRVVTLAAGNALHLEELVRATAGGEKDAPGSLLAIMSAQVELLPDAERRVLRAASVFGASFWAEGVTALLSGTLVPNQRLLAETTALTDSLALREILVPRAESRLAFHRELEFRNTLVRDVTYQMLTDEDRLLAHALAADWLESNGEVDPFVLADHRQRGGQMELAVTAYVRAIIRALGVSDFARVLDLGQRAKACGASGDALGDILTMEAEAHRWRGETRDCAAAAKRALEVAEPGSPRYFCALRHSAYAASFTGDTAELARLSTLLRVMPSDESLGDWTRAVAQAANGLVIVGHKSAHEELFERLEQFPPERVEREPELRDALLVSRGLRAYVRGDWFGLETTQRVAAQAKRDVGDERGFFQRLSNAGFASLSLGRYERALATYAEICEGAVKLNMTTLELNATQNSAFVRLCMGEYEAAESGSRKVLAGGKLEAPRSMAFAHLCLARALLAQGQLEDAEREARLGDENAPTSTVRMYAQSVLADILLTGGRLDEALQASEESLRLLRPLTSAVAFGDMFAHVIHAAVLRARGDTNAARDAIKEARQIFVTRRDFVSDDEARASFMTKSPDVQRLERVAAELAAG